MAKVLDRGTGAKPDHPEAPRTQAPEAAPLDRGLCVAWRWEDLGFEDFRSREQVRVGQPPPARLVRVVRFDQSFSPPSPPPCLLASKLQQVAERSGHCRTPTASARSRWALPDLNCKRQIAVGTTEPQQQVPRGSGHLKGKCQRKTSSVSHGWCRGKLGRALQTA